MSFRIVRKNGRENRVAETALVVILDIDDCLLIREEVGKNLGAAPLEWIKLRDLKSDRVDFGEDQSRFLTDELRVRVSDSSGEALH